MDEYFLQFLWKFQKFNTPTLKLTSGEDLKIFDPGFQNDHSGPDFHEAKIKISDLIWTGSVEIHYRASDWLRHKHQVDAAYENVVLHVVWIADREIKLGEEVIPTFEMSKVVSDQLEANYRKYIHQPATIRCGSYLDKIPDIQKQAMLDRALTDRLKLKSGQVLGILDSKGGDWEATTYQVLAKSFGFKTNAHSFEKLAQSLPYSVIRKYHGNPVAMDALIFGMAGYLDNSEDTYQDQLATEFAYLKKKHQLIPILMRHHWKHSKMRPANFPSVRLAQFSAFLANNQAIFTTLISLENKKSISSFLKKPLIEYWQKHFDFGKESAKTMSLGTNSLDLIMINAAVTLLTAYAKYLDDLALLDRAQSILEKIKAERNNIIDKWKSLDIHPTNAADSQALIHQYNHLCLTKKCLQCNIGMSILNRQ